MGTITALLCPNNKSQKAEVLVYLFMFLSSSLLIEHIRKLKIQVLEGLLCPPRLFKQLKK